MSVTLTFTREFVMPGSVITQDIPDDGAVLNYVDGKIVTGSAYVTKGALKYRMETLK